MARADAGAGIAVKIFVEEDEVAPVRIGLELLLSPVHGSPAVRVAEEDAREASRDLGGDVPERQLLAGAGRILRLEPMAVEVIELLQRLDQQEVHGEPDGATPVRIAAEQSRRGFARLVVDAVLVALHLHDVRAILVEA